MVKDKKRKKEGGGEPAPVRMQALYDAGDIAAARVVAARVAADASSSEDDKAAARKLLGRATVDARALQIFGLAFALAVVIVGVFLMH